MHFIIFKEDTFLEIDRNRFEECLNWTFALCYEKLRKDQGCHTGLVIKKLITQSIYARKSLFYTVGC